MPIGKSPEWVWRNPAQSSAWVARVAALLLAVPCAANILLIRVAFNKGSFQWIISISAAICAVLLIFRAFYGKQTKITEYAILLATGMWAANGMEIALDDFVRTESKVRGGGFYLTYAMLSGLFYLAERVGYHTDDTPVTKAVAIVDHVVEHVGGVHQALEVMGDVDATHVADVVIETHQERVEEDRAEAAVVAEEQEEEDEKAAERRQRWRDEEAQRELRREELRAEYRERENGGGDGGPV